MGHELTSRAVESPCQASKSGQSLQILLGTGLGPTSDSGQLLSRPLIICRHTCPEEEDTYVVYRRGARKLKSCVSVVNLL